MTAEPEPGPSPTGDPRATDPTAGHPTELGAEASVTPPAEPAPSLVGRIKSLWCAFVSGLG